MQYLLMAMEDADAFSARTDPDRADAYWQSWTSFIGALAASGAMLAAGGLADPATATTVRGAGGSTTIQDGPFADSKEQLGGYFLIEVDDLDAALAWAEQCPSAAYASVEVRPLLPPMTG